MSMSKSSGLMATSNFRDISGQVSYHDVNSMVRLGQRTELEAFLRQFMADLRVLAESDLRMAKSRLVSLVSTLVISVLEIGAPTKTEGVIADVAEAATLASTSEQLVAAAENFLIQLTVCAKPNSNRYAVQLIDQAKRIVRERYSEDITAEVVAEELHLSRSHFRYLFRAVTGRPFRKYLIEVRLTEARKLIERSHLSMKQVSAAVGYADPSGFNKAYRALHGVPPSAHRFPSADEV